MRTDDLIQKLSDRPRTSIARPALTIVVSALVSCAVVTALSLIWLGPRTDLFSAVSIGDHVLLLNFVFAISVGSAALAIVHDLSIPGRRPSLPSIAVVVPFLVMAGLAVVEMKSSPLHQFTRHADHTSWLTCLWQVLVLALPAFTILALGVRRLAPTDLRRSGSYVGLLAGAMGIFGYCLHAPGYTLTFNLVTYSAVILLTSAVGAIVGPRLLRWV